MTAASRERTPFGAFMRRVGGELADARRTVAVAPARQDSTWRRLSMETTPIPGESLRGLIARACNRNYMPNSWGLLQHMGQLYRNRVLVSEDENIDPAQLAYAIRVSEAEVLLRRYEPLKRGHVSFFGLDVHRRRIGARVRRFSPTSLKKKSYHRAAWELRDLPFCLESWDMLQDRCGCERNGVIQGWTRTLNGIENCDRCGDPLGWLKPFPVPSEMKSALGILKAIVDPSTEIRDLARDRLPEALRNTDRSELFGFVAKVAKTLDPYAGEHPINSPSERLKGLHEACYALSRWPRGFYDLDWPSDAVKTRIRSLRSEWEELGRHEHGSASVADPHSAGASKIPASYARSKRPIGLRPATELTRMESETLQAVWDAGLVTRHERSHGTKRLAAFDPDELVRLAKDWRTRHTPQDVAEKLGIPRYGVEQIVAAEALKADAVALPGTGPHFRPETLTRFLEVFEAARYELQNPVALQQIVLRIGGRPKPWGPLLGALHKGKLPYLLRPGRSLVHRLHVNEQDADRIVAMRFEPDGGAMTVLCSTMNQKDALELLNAGPNNARVLRDLPSMGINPKSYSVGDVVRLANDIVCVPEIAATRGLSAGAAYGWLHAQGVRERFPGAWCRRGAKLGRVDGQT
jgi:hypothetical protein